MDFNIISYKCWEDNISSKFKYNFTQMLYSILKYSEYTQYTALYLG